MLERRALIFGLPALIGMAPAIVRASLDESPWREGDVLVDGSGGWLDMINCVMSCENGPIRFKFKNICFDVAPPVVVDIGRLEDGYLHDFEIRSGKFTLATARTPPLASALDHATPKTIESL